MRSDLNAKSIGSTSQMLGVRAKRRKLTTSGSQRTLNQALTKKTEVDDRREFGMTPPRRKITGSVCESAQQPLRPPTLETNHATRCLLAPSLPLREVFCSVRCCLSVCTLSDSCGHARRTRRTQILPRCCSTCAPSSLVPWAICSLYSALIHHAIAAAACTHCPLLVSLL